YIGGFVPGSRGWCAAGAQILAGGMPNTIYWSQGSPLGSATPIGTVVATGWLNGKYPQMSPQVYHDQYGTIYHTGIFLGFDHGNAVILDQWNLDKDHNKPLGESRFSPDGWYEVNVPKDNGPYAPGSSTDPNGRGAVVVSAPPLSKNQRLKLLGLWRLARMNNPYWGYLPTTNTTNWAGGIAGLPGGGSPWDLDNQQGGVDPFGGVGSTWGEGFRPADEPGMGPGCFVAGTPV